MTKEKTPTTAAFVSQKGGVGKSALARLLAVGAIHRGRKTLLADFDLDQLTCVEWGALRLRASLERSLRALQFDYMDILFLHEPSLVRLPEAAELLAEVDRQKSKGAIRFIGLAGNWTGTIEIVKSSLSLADVVQVPENDWSDAELVPDLTFGALCREPQSAFEGALESDLVLHRLEAALRRRKNGSVVVSTTRIDHLDLLDSAAWGSTLD